MKSEWKTRRLADLVEFNPSVALKKGSIATKVSMDKLQPFTKKITAYEQAKYGGGAKFANGDTLLARITPCLENGKTAYVDFLNDDEIGFGSTEFIVMRAKEGVCDRQFVYYLATSPYFRSVAIKSMVGSTGRQRVQQATIEELKLPLPEIEEQERLGAFLALLDEKIALNRQINDNLQQLLFLLYENIILGTSCTKETQLSELCSFQEGYVNPAQTHPEYFDGEVKWLRAVDINESFIIETSRTLTRAGFESAKKSALLFKPNTIAISKSGTIGRLGIIADYMCGNRAVINIVPNNTNTLPFIYCFLKRKQREFSNIAVGSVQKNLYVSLLEPLAVSIPDDETLDKFNAAGVT